MEIEKPKRKIRRRAITFLIGVILGLSLGLIVSELYHSINS